MMLLTYRVLLIAAIVGTTAGAQSEATRVLPYPLLEGAAFQRAVETGTRTRDGRPGATQWRNHAHYAIEAELDPATRIVTGKATIKYLNRGPERIADLRIHLRRNIHAEGGLRLQRVEVNGGAKVTRVAVDGREVRGRRRRIQGTVMRLSLRRGLSPGETATVEIEWSHKVPDGGGAPRTGQTDGHEFFLAYWYPQIAVYEDVRGWVADPYLGPGEFYMEHADYDLSLTLPAGFLVQATGELINPEEVLPPAVIERLGAARQSHERVEIVGREDLEAGAVTLKGDAQGQLTWKFRAREVRDLSVGLSDRYLWDAMACAPESSSAPGGTLAQSLYRPTVRGWDRAAEFAQHAIEWMASRVAKYPWPHMTVVEGAAGGGMEFPMMTLMGMQGSAPALQYVTCHETIHMWFPMMVGTDEKSWGFMDEGMTTFLQQLCQDAFFQQDDHHRGYFARWRRRAPSAEHTICSCHADRFPFGTADQGDAVYTKPCVAFHQLRFLLGDETFFRCLRGYFEEWNGKHPHPIDLYRSFSRHAGRDLSWYFQIWFEENWHLDSSITAAASDETGTTITVEDLGRAFHPLTVEAEYGDGRRERREIPLSVWTSGLTKTTLRFEGRPKHFMIDPDDITLDADRANNEWPR